MTEPKKRGGARPGSGAKKKDPAMVRVRKTIQIPTWMVKAVDRIAVESGLTRSTVIVGMIEKYLSIQNIGKNP